MIHDPSPHRVSACPVHFIWDGRGRGRTFVRLGFLGVLAAGAVGSGAKLLRAAEGSDIAALLLFGSLALWGVGHVLGWMSVGARATAARPRD